MDIHALHGASPEDVAAAHNKDVEVQKKYGVNYRQYWINPDGGKLFCLCEAPDAETAAQVHAEAHGLLAEKIIEVEPDLAEGFLGGGHVNHSTGAAIAPGTADAHDPGIRTIVFTDIVDSTLMTQTLGDDVGMELVRVHNDVVRDALKEFGGREVKHTGDGIMASFFSAAAAVKCAAKIQRELWKREEADAQRAVKVRIGAAAGEPVEHHDDLFGCTVQLAARLCSQAMPKQILVSNVVAELCLGKGLSFEDIGEVMLKGFDRPVRAHAVALSG